MLVGKRIATALCLVILLISGCAEMPATVSGTVNIDGQPLPKGKLRFIPTAGGAHAIATIQPDGTFAVKTATRQGVEPGTYQVRISAFSQVPGPTMSEAQIDKLRLVPLKYWSETTSGLEFGIVKGANEFNIELTSQ